MIEKVITLPNRDEMLERLLKVSDNSHLQERFYPILLKQAGQERVLQGIVMMLALAIHDYVEGMPPVMANLMYMQAPDFIDALVSDAETAKESKELSLRGPLRDQVSEDTMSRARAPCETRFRLGLYLFLKSLKLS